ncbi:hypothetical protein [Phaeovulum sp. NW3]|uniref:hypothetical protein n=1 Tax=Phaeovulum sp. NW3 TaxID=2934933 RepID=UPI0020205734|nr:hypothetical protein [Phaeovulum sp. NW3]MCL7465608.1 hypothetical protein [Phaeovulum sp. NW3]
MRAVLLVIPALMLMGCDDQGPNLSAGVGFGDYQTYLAEREAALRGTAPAPVAPASAPPVPNASVAAIQSAPISVAPIAPAPADGAPLSAIPGLTSTTAPAPAPMSPPVATLPAATPPATAAAPNLAAYALQAPNRLGQPVWPRGGLALTNHDRACARFVSSDQAQMEFLRRGGPERDPRNLDPDGDGFACAWDPTPFQSVRN